MTRATRAEWDRQAEAFDDEPDHGLRDAAVRSSWAELLLPLLPAARSSVLDVGCGTGSLSVLLASAGHAVCGVDLSGRMLQRARVKAEARGVAIGLVQGDAGRLPFAVGSFDVLLVRHLLWAFDDPDAVLAGWMRRLKPQGCLVLAEGRWSTGAGLPASECLSMVLRHRRHATLNLLQDAALWDGPTEDERYLVHSPG